MASLGDTGQEMGPWHIKLGSPLFAGSKHVFADCSHGGLGVRASLGECQGIPCVWVGQVSIRTEAKVLGICIPVLQRPLKQRCHGRQ